MNNLKKNILQNLNLGEGKVTYNDFEIDAHIPLQNQLLSLKQDLLQIDFHHEYLIDIGWYPDFNIEGNFKIRLIKNFDWDNPLFEKKCRNISLLKNYIKEAIHFMRKDKKVE